VLVSNDRARLLPVLAGLAGLALAGLLTPAAAAAVTRGPHWVQAGALALDPQHPAALYVGTMGHGVLRLLLPDRP
jgi:hypothetical protein